MKKLIALLIAGMLTIGSVAAVGAAESDSAAVAAVTVSQKTVTLGVGETCTLTADASGAAAVAWSSDNEAVASVVNGVITAAGVGTTQVKATAGGTSASCTVVVKEAPAGISLNADNVTLGVGESFDIDVTYQNPDCARKTYYAVSPANIVSLNKNNGVITAKQAGTAVVTASTYNGLTATCAVTVKEAPKGITLNASALTLGVGEAFDLNVTYQNPDCLHKTYYSTNNAAVAAVNKNNGVITPKKTGTATITAKTYNGITAKCSVTVKPAPKGISLNATSLTLGVGEQFDINVTYQNPDCVRKTYYEVSDTDVISINKSNGVVTAKQAGSATVTAKTYNGKTAKCTVTVKDAPEGITLNAAALTLGAGEQYDLNVTYQNPDCLHKTYYYTSNAAVAAVNKSNGVVTPKKAGSVTITAKTYNGITATCKVTVKNAPTAISLNRSTATLGVGETAALKVTLKSGEWGKVVFTSNKTGVLTVNSATGALTAKSAGYATVTAKTYNGKTAKGYVTVKKAPTAVSFLNSRVTLQVGESVQFYLNSVSESEGFGSATFTCSTPGVTTVGAGGKVTAKKAGTSVVTATSYNGKIAEINVTVLNQTGYTKTTTSAATTMRAEAGWKYPSVASVPKGATVYRYANSTDGKWYKVKYGNSYGWMYNKAFGVKKNYTTIDNSTLPTVADDLIFDTGTSQRKLYDRVYDVPYRNSDKDTTENLCVEAFKYGRGSCYHHAALVNYLYNRCGWQTITVVGIDDLTGGSDHAWCLTKTANGWRHVDAQQIITYNGTFSNANQYFVTDKHISQFFRWERSKYPAAE